MLILTRRLEERIYIGDDIVITMLDIEGNRVKLGFDAPKSVNILREEVRNQKLSAKKALNTTAEDDEDENEGNWRQTG